VEYLSAVHIKIICILLSCGVSLEAAEAKSHLIFGNQETVLCVGMINSEKPVIIIIILSWG
jgi:hypothetical protein